MTARRRASRRSAPIPPARPTGTFRAHDSQICTALVLTGAKPPAAQNGLVRGRAQGLSHFP